MTVEEIFPMSQGKLLVISYPGPFFPLTSCLLQLCRHLGGSKVTSASFPWGPPSCAIVARDEDSLEIVCPLRSCFVLTLPQPCTAHYSQLQTQHSQPRVKLTPDNKCYSLSFSVLPLFPTALTWDALTSIPGSSVAKGARAGLVWDPLHMGFGVYIWLLLLRENLNTLWVLAYDFLKSAFSLNAPGTLPLIQSIRLLIPTETHPVFEAAGPGWLKQSEVDPSECQGHSKHGTPN